MADRSALSSGIAAVDRVTLTDPRRFAILRHDHPVLHWDFMFEVQEKLRTWRLLSEPCPGVDIIAEPLPVHRRDYLNYEGPVSGGRGTVERHDAGLLWIIQESPDRLEMTLQGESLSGKTTLTAGGDGRWTFRLAGPSAAVVQD